jgi:hypothetical protein
MGEWIVDPHFLDLGHSWRKRYVKCEAIPVTGRGGPWGCETSRLLHFLDNRLTVGDEFVSSQLKFTPPGRFVILISVRG